MYIYICTISIDIYVDLSMREIKKLTHVIMELASLKSAVWARSLETQEASGPGDVQRHSAKFPFAKGNWSFCSIQNFN